MLRRRAPGGLPSAALMAVAGLLMLLALGCIQLMSSVRAFGGAESAWAKAEGRATLALLRYSLDRDPAQWQAFQHAMVVPLAGRRAREAALRPDGDADAVRQAFLQGGSHPDDVAVMAWLQRSAGGLPLVGRSVQLWGEADTLVAELQREAGALHAAVLRGAPDAVLAQHRTNVLAIDARIAPLQQVFAETLGALGRRAQWLLAGSVAATTLVLTLLSLLLMRQAARRECAHVQALHDSEARRERALQGSNDGLWEWDLGRGTVHLSDRFETLLGCQPGALERTAAGLRALQHPDDLPAARDALRRHLREQVPYDVQLRMRHADGGWRWLRSRARCDRGPGGDELRLSGSITDITEQVEAQQALGRREALFRSLWETSTDAILIVDTGHVIRFANPAAHTMFGHPDGSLQDRPLRLLQPERLRAAHAHGAERYLRDGRRHVDWHGTEMAGLHADGREIPVEVCFSELMLDGRHHFVGFLRDITRRKQAEQALHVANEQLERRVAERTQALTQANQRLRELDRLKSEFLANMSHELRTPLNSILGFTGLMQRGLSGPLTPEQLRRIGMVHASGQHLLALINDVLELSRIESGRMDVAREPFDFRALADEALAQLQPLADSKGLLLRAEVDPGLAMHGDRRKVYQVLLNLLGNALKFTREGGVLLQARAADGRLHVAVRDSGIGMPPDRIGQLFQAFSQLDGSSGRRHEGTGLGLHLCRKLLGLMDGEISASSLPGAGSTFRFSLPLVLPPAPPPEPGGDDAVAGPVADPVGDPVASPAPDRAVPVPAEGA